MLLIDLNFENQYLLNRSSDGKTLYMKIDQKNTMNKNTLSIRPPHPSNIPHMCNSPEIPP